MTSIIVDSKLMAYNASYQRHQPIIATLDSIENAIKYMVNQGFIDGSYEVIMGFDFGKSRYRKELLTSYKGHRPEGVAKKSDAEQLEYNTFQSDYRNKLPELTLALGVRMIGVEGVEFDDLGSIVANKLPNDVILLTEDHDFFQILLAFPCRVRQFMPKSYRMLSASDITQLEAVTDKEEFLVAKAVKGDSGDSIKGIVQCGPACFDKWFTPLKGQSKSREEWKDLFIELCESNAKYKIHKDYDIDTYDQLFDLNIALGETMVGYEHFSKEEQDEFQRCMRHPLEFNEQLFYKTYNTNCEPLFNDFGDEVKPSNYPFLRGI